MKSPDELRRVLKRQWDKPVLRERRLLEPKNCWPLLLPVGRPPPHLFRSDFDAVKRHVESWKRVQCGQVIWESVRYRALASSVQLPTFWKLLTPSEWMEACGDESMRREFTVLCRLAEQTDPAFHSLLVRRRSLWRDQPIAEVIQAARLARLLQPGIAAGRPLRTLSLEGIDTKFFERHQQLLTAMLDVRFDGEAGASGLETFLGASSESDHWLVVMDLDGSLLPFRRQRVRSSELRRAAIPGERLLIVENESCQHHLPVVPKTVAVLGAGFDLSWVSNPTFAEKRVAYWGDIDTWGMQFLAQVRQVITDVVPLMMTAGDFARFAHMAVREPVVAKTRVPSGLTPEESLLYQTLLQETRGRLEQEFLPEEFVFNSVLNWANTGTELRHYEP